MSEDELTTQLDEMAAELLDRYEELTLLYDLGSSFASVFDVARICEIGVEKAARAIGTTEARVYLLGGEPDPVGAHVAATGHELLLHETESSPDGTTKGPLLSVPLVPPGDAAPIGALTLTAKRDGERFTAGDAKLAGAVATQLAAAINTTQLVDSLRAAEAVRREIEIAAGIQRSLLPERPPTLARASLAALCVPAANVGGDYYDFLVDETGRLSLVIADVAGHSIGSALMMAMARSILRRELVQGGHPAEVLAATNAALFDDLVRAGLFITVFCARLNPASGTLEYANGGHNPPLLHSGGATRELDGDGAAIGILRDVEFERCTATLADEDTLVLYTDGVTEAAAPGGEQFGEERLRACIDGSSPDDLVGTIYTAVRTHAGAVPQGDDVTLVALRRGLTP